MAVFENSAVVRYCFGPYVVCLIMSYLIVLCVALGIVLLKYHEVDKSQ